MNIEHELRKNVKDLQEQLNSDSDLDQLDLGL